MSRVLVGALALILGGLGLAACEPPPGASAGGAAPAADANIGSVSFQLTTGGTYAYQFNQVTYDISGNGFHRNATLDISHSASVSTVVSGIPFGAGYALVLTTQDTQNKLTDCRGAATFDVSSATTVPVPVDITCHQVLTQNPPAVPVPRSAGYLLAGLLCLLGATRVRRARS